MTGGLSDDPVGDFDACGLGGEASAHAVSGEGFGVVTDSCDVFLDDAGDCLGLEAVVVVNGAAFVDWAEEWPGGDVGVVEPSAGGNDGARVAVFSVSDLDVFTLALLVGFGSAFVDDEPFGVVLEVGVLEGGEF